LSAEPITVVPAQRARRGEWLARGAFEAALILLGLLGAFALNEWQDARARSVRVEALMTAVRAELEANLRLHEQAATYNREVADSIWNKGASGVTFIPDGTYTDGLLQRPRLTAAAWTIAQNDPALSDVPVEKLLLLANIYDLQRDHDEGAATLLNNMYASILQVDRTVLRFDGIAEPLRIGGVLRDNAFRGEALVKAYRSTLEQL
jgi:hypothetical protein